MIPLFLLQAESIEKVEKIEEKRRSVRIEGEAMEPLARISPFTGIEQSCMKECQRRPAHRLRTL
jgi:hypothetical protein